MIFQDTLIPIPIACGIVMGLGNLFHLYHSPFFGKFVAHLGYLHPWTGQVAVAGKPLLAGDAQIVHLQVDWLVFRPTGSQCLIAFQTRADAIDAGQNFATNRYKIHVGRFTVASSNVQEVSRRWSSWTFNCPLVNVYTLHYTLYCDMQSTFFTLRYVLGMTQSLQLGVRKVSLICSTHLGICKSCYPFSTSFEGFLFLVYFLTVLPMN